MKACFCNKAGRPRCCVLECESPNTKRAGCYPCHCWLNNERCLQTGERREKRKGKRR